jgi:hypothetical protein
MSLTIVAYLYNDCELDLKQREEKDRIRRKGKKKYCNSSDLLQKREKKKRQVINGEGKIKTEKMK